MKFQFNVIAKHAFGIPHFHETLGNLEKISVENENKLSVKASSRDRYLLLSMVKDFNWDQQF